LCHSLVRSELYAARNNVSKLKVIDMIMAQVCRVGNVYWVLVPWMTITFSYGTNTLHCKGFPANLRSGYRT